MKKKNVKKKINKKELDQFFDLFKKLKNKLDDDMVREFNRSLPIAELLSDRWERAKKLDFGKDTSVYDSSVILGDVSVGKNTWVGPYTILDGSGKLSIGDNCSISSGVQIYSHDSVQWAISGGKKKYEYAPTKIGDNCYIGPNVIIAKGVKLDDGCIVGANSFVNRSFKKGSKIAGNPAKIIK